MDLLTENLTLFNTSEVNRSSDNVSLSPQYCDFGVKQFGEFYSRSHPYAAFLVCTLGSVANIFNLIIFTRRDLINPTNVILAWLAVADLLTIVEYIPYCVYLLLPQRKSYGWALFVLIHSNFSQVCHTISIWLTVTLALWRYIMLTRSVQSKSLCSMNKAKVTVLMAYCSSVVLCVPIYISFSVTVDPTSGKYFVNLSHLAKQHPTLLKTNFWIYSVLIKLLPCVILTISTFNLKRAIREARKIKQKVMNCANILSRQRPCQVLERQRHSSTNSSIRPEDLDRTTNMLLVVLFLFLITEFPQGLLGLLSGIFGDAFFRRCYIPLADLMDLLALINAAMSFFLYYSCNLRFQATFNSLFIKNST